ncbi:MAG: DUF2242 domain-containing protein [Pseudomonadota bacterium]
MPASRALNFIPLLPALLALTACGAPSGGLKDSATASDSSPYQKQVAEDAHTACAAANRALLGDGYLTEPMGGDKVKGRKSYRNDGDRSTVVEMTVICLSDPSGGSTLYANGLRSTYELKKSATPASIGVSVIGSVSLPIGQSADSMVKTMDETISERDFYRKFFGAVENILNAARTESLRERKEPPHPAAPQL